MKHSKLGTKYPYEECVKDLSKSVYFYGLINFWNPDLDTSSALVRWYRRFSDGAYAAFLLIIVSMYASWLTQHGMSQRMRTERVMLIIAHTHFAVSVLWMFYNKHLISKLAHDLVVTFREMYHDEHTETSGVKKLRLFTTFYKMASLPVVPANCLGALIQTVSTGSAFNTVIMAWPYWDDRSVSANVIRVIVDILWFFFILKFLGTLFTIITLTRLMSQQFTNLGSYFRNISTVFDTDESIDVQMAKYQKAFKYGVFMHQKTLGCVPELQTVVGFIYTGQIINNTQVLVQIMVEVARTEVGVGNLCRLAGVTFVCLASTGLIMCNAGDITAEAADVASAMFESGWHLCRGSTCRRVRTLVTIAITQAQVPVQVKAFYFIPMSYETFVSVCKGAYSVFSVLIK